MTLPNLQQTLAANPILLYFAAGLAGVLVFFVIRFAARTLSTLIQLLIAILIGVGIYFLLKYLIF